MAISETLGDIAVVYQISNSVSDNATRSNLTVYTINARLVGSVVSRIKITALCYSNAAEGVSVNVIATGLENGVIRYRIFYIYFKIYIIEFSVRLN